MSYVYSTIGNDVESWMKHFKAMINCKSIPDEENGNFFLLNHNPVNPDELTTEAVRAKI